MQPQHQPPAPVHERFAATIAPQRRNPDRAPVENAEFLAMIWRMLRALESRAINDPEMLPQIVALAQRLAEITNVAIATSAARYAVNPFAAASMAECARVLGITKQSASERRNRGDQVIAERVTAAGAARFSEAARERQAIESAREHAAVSMADYRARHAAA